MPAITVMQNEAQEKGLWGPTHALPGLLDATS